MPRPALSVNGLTAPQGGEACVTAPSRGRRPVLGTAGKCGEVQGLWPAPLNCWAPRDARHGVRGQSRRAIGRS